MKKPDRFLKPVRFIVKVVELAGVEPASKRGSHMVSTCLSSDWFSNAGWPVAADLHLISFISPADRSLPRAILQLLRHLIRTAEGLTSGVTSRPGT
jgi:hypothetical protein